MASDVAAGVAANKADDVAFFLRTAGPLIIGSILELGRYDGPFFSPL